MEIAAHDPKRDDQADGGWSSPGNETDWNVEGASIAEQLREEVRAFTDVEYDE